jgi:hypothetical protein
MRRRPLQSGPNRGGLRDFAQKALVAIERAYEFAPNHYTWEARSAARALAKEIRKEAPSPRADRVPLPQRVVLVRVPAADQSRLPPSRLRSR